MSYIYTHNREPSRLPDIASIIVAALSVGALWWAILAIDQVLFQP